MGVTMERVEATPEPAPSRPKKSGKPTPRDVVAAVRQALAEHRGLSAGTIAWVLVPELRDYIEGMCGAYGLGNYPHDPDDFSRCRRILALIPNGATRIGEVALAFRRGGWMMLAPNWAELEALFVEEAKRADRHMPKLYSRMRELTSGRRRELLQVLRDATLARPTV